MGSEEKGVVECHHPTKIALVGTMNGKPFKSLADMDDFEAVIERCNQAFAAGMPKTGPAIPKRDIAHLKPADRRPWKKAA